METTLLYKLICEDNNYEKKYAIKLLIASERKTDNLSLV